MKKPVHKVMGDRPHLVARGDREQAEFAEGVQNLDMFEGDDFSALSVKKSRLEFG
jgi:hypothetical protein